MVAAQPIQWTGAVSSSWTTAGNWLPAGVPSASSAVTIPDTTAIFQPSTAGAGSPAVASLTLQSNAVLQVDPGDPLTVSGDISIAVGAMTTGGGEVITGASTVSGAGSLCRARVAGPTIIGTSFLIASGGLTVQSGSLSISAGSNLTVQGPTTFAGGGWTAGAGASVTFNGVTVSGGATITAPVSLAPTSLQVDAGSSLTVPTLDCNGPCQVLGALTLGAGAHAFAAGLDAASGSLTFMGGASVAFDGPGNVLLPPAQALPAVTIAGPGTVTAAGDWSAPSLAVPGGTLSIPSGTVTISGAATFNGGVLSGATTALLDVAGNVTWSGGVGGSVQPPGIRCGGDWTATPGFNPSQGSVLIDGTSPTLSDPGGAGPLNFFDLTIASAGAVTFLDPFAVANDLMLQSTIGLPGGLSTVGGAFTLSGGASVTGTVGAGLSIVGATTINTGTTLTLDNWNPSGVVLIRTGGVVVVNGVADVDEMLTVEAGGALTLSTNTHTFARGIELQANNVLSATGSTMRFDGPGAIDLPAGGTLPEVEVASGAGTVTTDDSFTVDGSLTQTSGTLSRSAGTITVMGDGVFSGGSLAGVAGSALIDVAGGNGLPGDVFFQGTSATADPGDISVARDWTADGAFAPNAGRVVFAATGAQTIAGAGNFHAVEITSGSTTSSAIQLQLGGDLILAGSLSNGTPMLTVTGNAVIDDGSTFAASTTTLDVGQNLDVRGVATVSTVMVGGVLTIGPNGVLNLGTGTHTITQGLVFSSTDGGGGGSGGQIVTTNPAATTLLFTGVATLAVQTGTLTTIPANVEVGGSAQVTVASDITFDEGLTLSQGAIGVGAGQTLMVAQDLTFTGGALFEPGSGVGVIDVSGGVSFVAGGVSVASTTVRCAGTWSTTPSGATPTWGRVELVGTGQQVTGSPLRATDLVVTGSVAPSANLEPTDLTIQPGASVNLTGGARIDLSGALDHQGTLTGGRLRCVGQCSLTTAPGSDIPDLEIASNQNVLIDGLVQVTGPFMSTAGTLLIDDGVLEVGGNATMAGGSVLEVGSATLDVAGDVVWTATSVFELPRIECAGDWTSSASFQPTGTSLVVFDGVGAQTVDAPGSVFLDVTIEAGSQVDAPSGLVVSGVLDLDGALQSLTANVVVETLDAAAGSALTLGPGVALETIGDLTFAGTWTGGLLRATQPGSIDVTGSIPALEVDAPGSVGAVGTLSVLGNVDLIAGTFLTVSGAQVDIGGDLTSTGGTIADGGSGTGLIDVAGNVDLTGSTFFIEMPDVRCAGNWISNAGFRPPDSLVMFVGGAATVDAAGSVFDRLEFGDGTTPAVVTALTAIEGSGSAVVTANAQWVAPLGFSCDSFDLFGTADFVADVEFHGDATLHPGSILTTLPTTQLAIGGDLDVDEPMAVPGLVRFVGAGEVALMAGAALAIVEVATLGTVEFTGLVPVQTLTLTDGAIVVASGATLQVTGPSQFAGGLLAGLGTARLEVGDVTFSGTNVAFGPPDIECAGTWTSDAQFVPPSGLVTFVGSAGIQSVTAVTPFHDLTIAGSNVMASSPVAANGDVRIQGGADLTAPTLSVGGELTLQNASALQLGNAPITVHGDATFDGALVGVTRIVCAGEGLLSGAAPLPELEIATPSVYGVNGALSVTALFVSQGTLAMNSSASIDVSGDVELRSMVSHIGGGVSEIVALTGSVLVDGADSMGESPLVRCGGDWTFVTVPVVGISAQFEGPGTRTVSGPGARFLDLSVASGVTVDATGPASVDVRRDLTVEGTVTGFVRTVGSGQLAGDGQLDAYELAAGQVTVPSSAQLTIAAEATFSGGSLQGAGAAALDVMGPVSFLGTASTAPPGMTCGGDWTADGNFAPTSGIVTLTGMGTMSPATPGGTLRFAQCAVSGTYAAGDDVVVAAGAFDVTATGAFSTGGHDVSIDTASGATTVDVDGALTVQSGDVLALGAAATVSVSASGTLALAGQPASPATIAGIAGGGYGLTVDGILDAQDFVIREMGASGVVVTNAATIVALQSGTFSHPANVNGARLLDLERPAPVTFQAIGFDDPLGVSNPPTLVVYNVRVTQGSVVTFNNATGNLAGEPFEEDPTGPNASGLIAWTNQATLIPTFGAAVGAGFAQLTWTGHDEAGVATWIVERQPFGGVSVVVAESPATGAFSYEHLDAPLSAVSHTWRLFSRSSSGVMQLRATAMGTPQPASTTGNVLIVGPSGPFTTIQAAVDAVAASGAMILVDHGTYGAFQIDASVPSDLLITGTSAGARPVIDISAGPVLIDGLPSSSSVMLRGLDVGDGGGMHAAVVVRQSSGLVVLDGARLTGGAGAPAVTIEDSDAVGLQHVDAIGTPGVHAWGTSRAIALHSDLGDVVVGDTASLRVASSSTGMTTVDPAAALVTVPFAAPDLAMPMLVAPSIPSSVEIIAPAGASWWLVSAPSVSWSEDPLGPWPLPLLLDPSSTVVVNQGVMAPSGRATFGFTVDPATASVLLATPPAFQVVITTPAGPLISPLARPRLLP